MKRLLHWGPIFTLIIIKFEALTTLYFTSFWLKFQLNNPLSLINYLSYYSLLIIIIYNFICSILIGPGTIDDEENGQWKPPNENDEKFVQYCYKCKSYKIPRSHHCSKCGKCIKKMDHHCPFINNCVGYRNQKYFYYFLLSAVIGSIQTTILSSITLYKAFRLVTNYSYRYHSYDNNQLIMHLTVWNILLIIISIGMAVGVMFAVGFLLYLQTRIIVQNRTSIENWIIEKANNRKRDKPFIYPYDLGTINNIKQVLWEPLSDGIEYPVRNGCNQYTLTYEQIQQKKDKIDNASIYRIIRAYNGRFFPLFSQGLRTCITFPINDDPRLALNVGDEVLVTHSYKYWFYGRKLNTTEKIPKKGWFPSQCATLMLRPTMINQNTFDYVNNYGDDHIDNEQMKNCEQKNDDSKKDV